MRAGLAPRAKTIPVSCGIDRQLAHVIPICGATRNFFYEARLLLVMTKVDAAALVPSKEILTRLYQLTDSEARLARMLAAGRSLKDSALLLGISYGTARSYLVRIFRKTETNQQSELVAVLKTTAQISVIHQ
ncbi:helix-turn-helix transcriptional regulator [Phyllobacterium sp. TAF24]|uniref:helix-turn-helix transcriptional regulator n=1 Tax=Phyllobacterium sp. TAF24 TaxID=3233068 RepID=UPI003F972F9A